MSIARERRRPFGVHAALCLLMLPAFIAAQQPGGAAPTLLKIVVLEGEGAVNIIQQKTAVRALVEVRDRNNLPVSGAAVTFKVGGQGGAALAGGSPTITVTTNSAGRAALSSGLTPTAPGTVQISVSAVHQGLAATTVIAQSVVATVAQGAAIGGAVAAGAAAGGGGLGTGAVIGIVAGGAAVGGGVLAATGSGGSGTGGSGTAPSSPSGTAPTGPQAARCVERQTNGGGNEAFTGVFEMGSNSGTFQFRYDSGNFEDQFVVVYEGRTIFDSGCVGTGAGVSATQTLAYAGTATSVTVNVNANCTRRPDNPYWNFTVSCPR